MSELVEKKEDLIRYFGGRCETARAMARGTEYEKVAVRIATRMRCHSGPGGVEQLLRRMADRYGFEPEEEHGRILALKGERSAITIEPAGKSSSPANSAIPSTAPTPSSYPRTTIDRSDQPTRRDRARTRDATAFSHRSDRAAAKARYNIMYPYMARKGTSASA